LTLINRAINKEASQHVGGVLYLVKLTLAFCTPAVTNSIFSPGDTRCECFCDIFTGLTSAVKQREEVVLGRESIWPKEDVMDRDSVLDLEALLGLVSLNIVFIASTKAAVVFSDGSTR
jgi:hypothetical protein